MSSFKLPSLVIPEAATVSNALDGTQLRFAEYFTIYPPAALSGVVTIEVSDLPADVSVAADWRVLADEAGAARTLTADEAMPVRNTGFGALRLSTTIAPGVGGETHDVRGIERTVISA